MTVQTSNTNDALTISEPEYPLDPGKLKFASDTGFLATVRRRVAEYFQRTGKSERDVPRMYLKTAAILGGYACSYALLVFVVNSLWLAIPLAILLAGSMAMVGFSVQHDGNHRAYSNRPWVNKLAAFTLDLPAIRA